MTEGQRIFRLTNPPFVTILPASGESLDHTGPGFTTRNVEVYVNAQEHHRPQFGLMPKL